MKDLGRELEEALWRIAGWERVTKIMFGTCNYMPPKNKSSVGNLKLVSKAPYPNCVVLRGYDQDVTRDVYVYFTDENSMQAFMFDRDKEERDRKELVMQRKMEQHLNPRRDRRAIHAVLRKVKG